MAKKNKIQELRDAMNASFRERDEVVDGMLAALLSKQMLFLLGPPGTGKSAICEALCSSIGGSYFSWLLSKFSTPEELFGPVSMKGYENDEYRRVTKHKLPEASVAFLDEIFKGSSAILNTLLPVINERTFYNGSGPERIPLQVLFGASNEIPQGEELAPLWDRFVLRYVVSPMSDSAMEDLILNGLKLNLPKLSEKELMEEQEKAQAVKLPSDIVKIILEIRKAISNEGIYVSDRKWNQIIPVIKAYAHVSGHSEVTADDLAILSNVLWNQPEEQKRIKKLVAKYSNPMGEQILKYLDAAVELEILVDAKKVDAGEAQKKIKDGLKALKSLGDPEQNQSLKKAIARVNQINLKVVKEHLGLEL